MLFRHGFICLMNSTFPKNEYFSAADFPHIYEQWINKIIIVRNNRFWISAVWYQWYRFKALVLLTPEPQACLRLMTKMPIMKIHWFSFWMASIEDLNLSAPTVEICNYWMSITTHFHHEKQKSAPHAKLKFYVRVVVHFYMRMKSLRFLALLFSLIYCQDFRVDPNCP